jgi:hypothetical protein
MKKNTRTKTTTAVADPRKVRAILLDAASRVEERSDQADDARLLAAARGAQNEISFTEMYQTVSAVNGSIELLFHTIEQAQGDVPDDVNWMYVTDLLDDCRRRMIAVCCALYHLENFERTPDTKGGAHV